MGGTETKLSSEEIQSKLEHKNFEHSRESRNYLRKVFLKHTINIVKLVNRINSDILSGEMSKMAKVSEINIPVFDGQNYNSWKFRLMSILEYNDCDTPAKKKRTDEEAAVYSKQDKKAKTILISAV